MTTAMDLALFKEKIFDFEASKEWSYKGQRPAIIDFYADWCGPCHMLAPILEQVAETYQGLVDVYKIDTDANPELSALFEVRGIPTLVFVPMDESPAISSGVLPPEAFEKAISDLFGISKPESN